MLTSQSNVDPFTPHFYIVQLGFTGVYMFFFLIIALKQRLWVLVSTVSILNEAVLTCTINLYFEQTLNKKNITSFHLKIIIFTAFKIAAYCICMFA